VEGLGYFSNTVSFRSSDVIARLELLCNDQAEVLLMCWRSAHCNNLLDGLLQPRLRLREAHLKFCSDIAHELE